MQEACVQAGKEQPTMVQEGRAQVGGRVRAPGLCLTREHEAPHPKHWGDGDRESV